MGCYTKRFPNDFPTIFESVNNNLQGEVILPFISTHPVAEICILGVVTSGVEVNKAYIYYRRYACLDGNIEE